jgi:trans-2,3-dihydro-3-hydroxyanthranilate isomerase
MTAMGTLRYVLCDVFTDTPLAGNPLAVFTDARGLSADRRQALASEMGRSETVFVQPAEAGGHARLRIHTPCRELAFAGHPTLGAAFVLGQPMQLPAIRLETGAGLVEVELEREGARVVFGRMGQPIPKVEPAPEPEAVLSALGVARSSLPIEVYDNGIRHALVTLDAPDEVAALRPDPRRLAAIAGIDGFSVSAGSGTSYTTRMFAPAAGVAEDPATGSAAGPIAVHLGRHGRVAFGQEIRIAQGAELGRVSTLYACAYGSAERIERVEVGGAAVVVARGEFRL